MNLLEQKFADSLVKIPIPEVSCDLMGKITDKIRVLQNRRIKINLALTFAPFLIVFSAVCYLLYTLIVESLQLGIDHILWSAYQDFGTVVANWQEYLMSLLELVPVFSIILNLIALALLIVITKVLAKNLNNFIHSLHFNH